MNRRISALGVALAALLPFATAATGPDVGSDPGLATFPAPVDPQSWELPEWMTWDDYRPLPGDIDWNAPERQPVKKLRAAVILGDFQDREFVVTQPEGSDVIGLDGVNNPIGIGDVPREEVADWYADFLIREPSERNQGHTVNEYWLEDSYGKVGVDAGAFGPYRLEGKEHEYGLGGGDAGGGGSACPTGDTCGRDFDTELLELSTADVTAGIVENGEDYDFRYLIHAGYDESGVWQEFGEMLFPTKEDVTDAFGNPDPTKPNWAPTRYIDWSSFAASKGIWSHALPGVLSTQGENDGHSTFAHELSHIFGVLDNYNNPFGTPLRRSYTGTWAQLSRGTFNGPGGTHNRWQIPPSLGGTMGSHHMLRNKMRLGFVPPNEVLTLERDTLSQLGPQVATIYPRAYPLAPVTEDVGLHGVQVLLSEDRSECEDPNAYDCDRGGYTSYTMEFVDRIGFDSFTTDSGVLIAKNKDIVDLAPFMWAIDAHPEDLNTRTGVGEHEGREIFDFVRPGTGEKVPISLGDARQLADGLFHAGTGEGVVSEYVDEANRLHFYVLGTDTDERGVSTYRVAVRSLDGAGPFPRGVTLDGADGGAHAGRVATTTFTLTNTGPTTDLVRLAVDGDWAYRLQHEVVEVPGGGSIEVPVYVAVPDDATTGTTGAVTLTATSESDPEASAEATATVTTTAADGTDGTDTSPGDVAAADTPLPTTGGGLAAFGVGTVGLAAALRRRVR